MGSLCTLPIFCELKTALKNKVLKKIKFLIQANKQITMSDKVITAAVCYESGKKNKCTSPMSLKEIIELKNNLTDNLIPIWQFFKNDQCMIV